VHVKHSRVSHTYRILFNFSIHWNLWFTARRASWIYEQAGQTPTHNAPDDARVRKGLEETTGHKDVINTSSHKRSHVIQLEITRSYSDPIPHSTFRMSVQCPMSHDGNKQWNFSRFKL